MFRRLVLGVFIAAALVSTAYSGEFTDRGFSVKPSFTSAPDVRGEFSRSAFFIDQKSRTGTSLLFAVPAPRRESSSRSRPVNRKRSGV